MKDQRWLWEEQLFTLAPNVEVHDYIARHLQEVIVLDKQPIKIYEHNVQNVVRGRREHMLVFYHLEVEPLLHYINSALRGNITAIRVR